jgi:hypothetical protein
MLRHHCMHSSFTTKLLEAAVGGSFLLHNYNRHSLLVAYFGDDYKLDYGNTFIYPRSIFTPWQPKRNETICRQMNKPLAEKMSQRKFKKWFPCEPKLRFRFRMTIIISVTNWDSPSRLLAWVSVAWVSVHHVMQQCEIQSSSVFSKKHQLLFFQEALEKICLNRSFLWFLERQPCVTENLLRNAWLTLTSISHPRSFKEKIRKKKCLTHANRKESQWGWMLWKCFCVEIRKEMLILEFFFFTACKIWQDE